MTKSLKNVKNAKCTLKLEGTATVLDTYHGLPSDENFLNRMLEKTNEDFAELLEIQQEYD